MYRRKPQGWRKHIDFILLDIFCFMIAFVLAVFTRLGKSSLLVQQDYLDLLIFYLVAISLLHILNNTFSGVLKRGFFKEFVATVVHVSISEMLVIAYLFLTKQSSDYSRIVLVLVVVYYILFAYVVRVLWKWMLQKKGHLFSRAALHVVTTRDLAEETVKRLNRKEKAEYEIQGMCILDEDCVGEVIEQVPVTANRETLVDYLCDKWVDEVYIDLPPKQPCPNEIINKLTEMGITVHIRLDEAGTEAWQHRQVQYVGGQLAQTVSITNVSSRELMAKRAIDIVGGIIGSLITVVLTVILAPLIYIHSPGPIFFSQIRVGKNGKPFKMYKFRSMYPDAEARKAELMEKNQVSDGRMFKMEADPRIIGCKIRPDGTVKKGLGNFMRDYSLDEFPQFFNVLKGDLSLVGTRPPTVDEWEKYLAHHRARLSTRPGITGLWQVSGRSKITDFEEIVRLDMKYIREWSMGMDIRILLKTVAVVLRKEGSM